MDVTSGAQDGQEIRRLREAADLTVRALAEKVGIHQGSLTNIELGKQPASLDVLVSIAGVLGKPLLQIVRPGTSLHTALTSGENGSAA